MAKMGRTASHKVMVEGVVEVEAEVCGLCLA